MRRAPRKDVAARAAAPAAERARIAALRRAILRWYLAHRRDLPWRRTRDPYAIWVSEIMLQQTRVDTVAPYYERFLQRFPTVRDLARGPERDVLACWSGLGYYRRARRLREAAVAVVREHDGALPRDPEVLRGLPGIGEYTAAAIASVAFGIPAAAVDGNVLRVLVRIEGLRGGRDDAALRRRVTRIAEALAEGPGPGDWTQALMELGATVCTARAPRCDACPAARACAALEGGAPARYPTAARTPAPRAGREVLLLARRGGRVLLVRDGDAGHETWTLPRAIVRRGGASSALQAAVLAAARVAARAARLDPLTLRGPLATFRHRTYSHDLALEVWEAGGVPGRAGGGAGRDGARRWVRPEEATRLPVRAPTLKALKRVGRCDESQGGRKG